MNKFKEKIQNGEAVLGTFIELNNPLLARSQVWPGMISSFSMGNTVKSLWKMQLT